MKRYNATGDGIVWKYGLLIRDEPCPVPEMTATFMKGGD